jgi:hypothetical protein
MKLCALANCNEQTESPRHKFCCDGHKYRHNDLKKDTVQAGWGNSRSQFRLDKKSRSAAKRQKSGKSATYY